MQEVTINDTGNGLYTDNVIIGASFDNFDHTQLGQWTA